MLEQRTLDLDSAQRILAAALSKAEEMEAAVSIAVVGAAGDLKAFLRMDASTLMSVQISHDKAYSAVAAGIPTHEWWERLKDNPPLLHGIGKASRVIVFGGGVPVRAGGQIVGAIGVAGAMSRQDREIAEAGSTAIS